MWLQRAVAVLYTLSTSGVLGEGIGLVRVDSFHWHAPRNTFFLQPFPPVKAIFAGIALLLAICVSSGFTREDPCGICGLHQALKDVSTSYDALVDLFESFESFLRRPDIYTKITSITAMTGIIVKILIELLSTSPLRYNRPTKDD